MACFILYMVLDIYGLTGSGVTEKLADASLGVVFGMLMMGALYTSRFFPKIDAIYLCCIPPNVEPYYL